MRFASFSIALLLGSVLLAQTSDSNPDELELTGGYEFTVHQKVDATPIKDQCRTGTCWSFSTLSFLESEILREQGKSMDLSEMFAVRYIYLEKALNYVGRQGLANFSQGSLSHDVLHVIRRYGMVPESAYPGLLHGNEVHRHGEMEAVLKGMLDGLIKNKNGELSPSWIDAVNGVLDAYLGEVPEVFTYEGKKHTARSFADKVMKLNPDNYISLTSFENHPYYTSMVLNIPDNFSNGAFLNVSVDELYGTVNSALAAGMSVTWDTDVSEQGFSGKRGIAVLPEEWNKSCLEAPCVESKVTPEERQRQFDSWSTTDDHLMHIMGAATDQNGVAYFLVKNSWGEVGPYDGYIYASKAYFQMKTISILVHKDALGKDLRKKLKL